MFFDIFFWQFSHLKFNFILKVSPKCMKHTIYLPNKFHSNERYFLYFRIFRPFHRQPAVLDGIHQKTKSFVKSTKIYRTW